MADHVVNSDDLAFDTLEGGPNHTDPAEARAARERTVGKLRLLWNQRQIIFRVSGAALLLSTLVAFLIPKRFESTTRLMPPTDGSTGMALLAAVTGGKSGAGSGSGLGSGIGSGLGSIAGTYCGMKNSGEFLIGT